jgi:hypothetical protein
MNDNLKFWRRRLSLLATIAVILASIGTGPAATAQAGVNSNPGVLPPNSNPYGRSYEEWTRAWVRWIMGISADQNPLLDETGANCDVGQSGHVWFLAGNFGGTTVRNCVVPNGKALFFPVINAFWVNTEGETDQQMLDGLANLMALIDEDSLQADVDGRQVHHLPRYKISRIVQPDPLRVFNVALVENNILGAPAGTYRGVGDGYYLMLAPLSRGQHTIHFHGEVPDFDFVVDVTYNLTVGR